VIAQERTPALQWHTVASRSIATYGHVLAHGSRGDPQAQLEQQFVGNASLAPGEVVARHLPDE
jgi:hypothetical protein